MSFKVFVWKNSQKHGARRRTWTSDIAFLSLSDIRNKMISILVVQSDKIRMDLNLRILTLTADIHKVRFGRYGLSDVIFNVVEVQNPARIQFVPIGERHPRFHEL